MIEIIIDKGPNGEDIEFVAITNGDTTTIMRKDFWDEQEAQKELGGTLTNQGGLN